MKQPKIPQKIFEQLLIAQRNEITEYHIYNKLSKSIKNKKNSDILKKIANDELKHYEFWFTYTNKKILPNKIKIWFYFWIARILGITFGVKLMERGEENAQVNYTKICTHIPKAQQVINDEDKHEKALIKLIDEERLQFIGSIVLGLNDALVELTGALAGLTFALQNTRLVALAGLITGIAASFSMASSEYLSTKSEGQASIALKSSIYTGIAYIITVILLILPFLLLENPFTCLALTLLTAVIIICVFNYYISVAKDYSFKKRFFEMSALSLGIALLSFGIGYVVRYFIGIDI